MSPDSIYTNMRLIFYNPRCGERHLQMVTVIQTNGFSGGPIIRFDDGLQWLCYSDELQLPTNENEQARRCAHAEKYL